MARLSTSKLVRPYTVTDGRRFRLADFHPDDTDAFGGGKAEAEALLQESRERLRAMQERLYAQDRWGVLLIFQAMDAAGKDGAIEHVMSGVNPQGCQVFAFKQPSAEELDHDFMWRNFTRLPERGRIGIFNRSYYEEVLVVRVHPGILAAQRLPPSLVTKTIWRDRYEDIAAFERYLSRNGFLILKFFLHISREEQIERLTARLDDPEKNWKFAVGDLKEGDHWDDYMQAYEEMIRATAAPDAPWIVVPSNRKWFARLVVAAAVVHALDGLDLAFPPVDAAKRRELEEGRRLLRKARGQ